MLTKTYCGDYFTSDPDVLHFKSRQSHGMCKFSSWQAYVQCHMAFVCSVSHDIHMFSVMWHLSVQCHMTFLCSASHGICVFSVTWQAYVQCHMAVISQ